MDKYEKVRKIGEGAFGKALLVRRKDDNKQCVVKEVGISRVGILFLYLYTVELKFSISFCPSDLLFLIMRISSIDIDAGLD